MQTIKTTSGNWLNAIELIKQEPGLIELLITHSHGTNFRIEPFFKITAQHVQNALLELPLICDRTYRKCYGDNRLLALMLLDKWNQHIQLNKLNGLVF